MLAVVSLRASGVSDFVICLWAGTAVAEPAGRGLYVHVSGASEPLQERIWSLRLLCQTLLCPFSQGHHHTDYPEDKQAESLIDVVSSYNTIIIVLFYGHAVNSPLSSEYQLSYLDRAPRPRKEFWEPASLLSVAAICCSSEEVSSHIDCPLCIHAHSNT